MKYWQHITVPMNKYIYFKTALLKNNIMFSVNMLYIEEHSLITKFHKNIEGNRYH